MPKPKTTPNQFSLSDYFPAFKSGLQTDSAGNAREWTNDDLDQIVKNTNSRIEKNIYSGTPFVIGHPKTNDPAYGWTAGVRRVGDELQVKGDKIHDAFESGVENGRWPNRSIRISQDDSGYYLKHVGFLGAAAPAVDGLEAVYSANDNAATFFDYTADFDFTDSYTPSVVARLFRGVRDFIIDKFDVETADQVIPDYSINSLSEHANELQSKDKDLPSSFNKPNKDDGDPMPTQAEMDAAVAAAKKEGRDERDAEFSASETTLKDQLEAEKAKTRLNDFNAVLEPLRADGHIVPADEGVLEFMAHICSTGDDAAPVTFNFSSGEGAKAKTMSVDPKAWFLDFVKRRGPVVDMSQLKDEDVDQTSHDFFRPQGTHVDADRLALDRKARDYMAKHQGVDYVSAIRHVEREG